ncbi:hypothetical protein AN958_07447 [Leucoagaricus sp. SymC.cos]|nr:hypothetical protein AN958_07447 [Leucoagaricus sp. SymC.cos]
MNLLSATHWTVHFLFLLEAVQSILVIADAFHWFVYNFGDYNGLLDLAYSSIDGPILDSFIAFVVQLVYCWRIWVLSRRRIAIPAIIALCALVSCIGGFVRGIKGYTVKRTPGLPGHLDAALILWNTAGALTDILIASSMTYLLLKLSSESTNHGVLRVMRRIGLLTLEANILTGM